MGPLRTAVVGFGTAGRVFHTPFVAANPDYALTAVVTVVGLLLARDPAQDDEVAVPATEEKVLS